MARELAQPAIHGTPPARGTPRSLVWPARRGRPEIAKAPPERGLRRSRPVSRILSLRSHPSIATYLNLDGPPTDGSARSCTGWGLPGRRVTATPVRSYRTISTLPVRRGRGPWRHRRCISVALSRGFPRVGSPTTLPCGVRTFLERVKPVRGCVACPRDDTRGGPADAGPSGPRRAPRRASRSARSPAGRPGARGGRGQPTFRRTPTTLPSTRASRERIGSMSGFSGCSRMWSLSRK